MHQSIDKYSKKRFDFIDKIQFPSTEISAKFKDYEKFEMLVNQMIQFKFKDYPAEEQQEFMENSFSIWEKWICSQCEHHNKKNSVECVSCRTFKPLDLYPTFFNNSSQITQNELAMIEKRRSKEKSIVCKKDSNYPEDIQLWYLIDAEWLKDWKSFVGNKKCKSSNGARMCKNEEVGILEPGPISNVKLITADAARKLQSNNPEYKDIIPEPKPNLKRGENYRGVNQDVWRILSNIYGGGPTLVRKELDIYSPHISEQEINDIDMDENVTENDNFDRPFNKDGGSIPKFYTQSDRKIPNNMNHLQKRKFSNR